MKNSTMFKNTNHQQELIKHNKDGCVHYPGNYIIISFYSSLLHSGKT